MQHFIERLERRRLLTAGGLDFQFGGFGAVRIDYRAFNSESADMTIYRNGAILVASLDTRTAGKTILELRRFNSDGSPDASFPRNTASASGPSQVNVELPAGEPQDPLRGVNVRALEDGGLLARVQHQLLRFTAAGTLDRTFADNGMYSFGEFAPLGFDAQADGAVLVTGSQTVGDHSRFATLRLLADGSRDESFGPRGVRAAPFTPSIGSNSLCWFDTYGASVVRQPDGGAYIVGYYSNFVTETPARDMEDCFDRGFELKGSLIQKLRPDGSLDTSFADRGTLVLHTRKQDTLAIHPILLDDGSLFVGMADDLDVAQRYRIAPDGSVNPGATLAGAKLDASINGVVLQDAGKAVLLLINHQEDEPHHLVRVNAAGELDKSFRQSTLAPLTHDDFPLQMGTTEDGAIVVFSVNFTQDALILHKYWPDDGPVAALRPVRSPHAGDRWLTISVRYRDAGRISAHSLDDRDLLVSGAGHFQARAEFLGAAPELNGAVLRARYRVRAPGGRWNAADDGSYRVQLLANQVSSTAGRFATAHTIGSFTIALPAESRPPAQVLPQSRFARTWRAADDLSEISGTGGIEDAANS